MSVFLVLALYWFTRRFVPEWAPWVLRGTLVFLVLGPQLEAAKINLTPILILLFGVSIGYWYRDTKSA